MGSAKLALTLLAAALLLPAAATLKIGAFNIRTFGDSKMSNKTIAGIIVTIVLEYDIILVQEVRDTDLSAVKNLMDQLNSVLPHPYTFLVSKPLGQSTYKEQYLFIYKTEVVSVVDTYQYEDPQDVFSREPFILRVSSPHTSERWKEAEEFVLVPLHSAPHAATAEIDALYDVYLAIVSKWDTDPDSADTTVGKSDCAYDRIVVCGSKLKRSIVPNSATVYNFQRAFQLEQEEALAVSDHFPVEVKLAA
nr:PREDICTED: deoxyribonuclease-1 [Struthio camelus australis]